MCSCIPPSLHDHARVPARKGGQFTDGIAPPLPGRLRGGGTAKEAGAILAKGLLQEVDADLHQGEPLWRETGDGQGTALVATDAGRAAIGLVLDGAATAPSGAIRTA